MIKIVLTLVLLSTSFMLQLQFADAQQAPDNYPVIPRPVSLIPGKGVFKVSTATEVIVLNDELSPDAEILVDYIFMHYGYRLKISSSKSEKPGAINLVKRKNDPKLAPDGYRLSINDNIVRIEGGSGSGAFYGLQTLIQLLPAGKVKVLDLQGVQIEDYPRFGWRGMHLDVCRHFFSKEFVKKYIDYLALYKMNRFHWHLTEDQGWRIEIKKYPKLQEKSAYRSGTLIGHYGSVPEQYDSIRYGGFYSQQDIREIVAYATQRHITIIPEIELPGHAQAALAAYPELSCTGGPFEVAKTWGVFQDVYCPKEETFTFLENVLTEVCALFPGPYIHIGGDECPKERWKHCQHCQDLMKKEGLRNEQELQSYFVRRIEKFLESRGKRIIGWDEILEGELAPDATVMSWRGSGGGITAARLNHDVIMSPTGFCYFDFYQSRNPDEPLAIGGYLPIEKVYQFEPLPDSLTTEESKHILGGQGNVWTEYLSSPQQVEYMVFPRIGAMSEALWSPKEMRNFNSFCNRLVSQFKLLDFLDINYSKAIFDINSTVYPNDKHEGVEIELKSAFKRGRIYYSMDGSEPTLASSVYKGKISIDQSVGIKAALFDAEIRRGSIWKKLFQLNLATGKEVVLANRPHEEYSRGGGFALVDGVTGALPWVGSDWLGFSGTDLNVIVDLGLVRSFSKVGLDLLHDESSDIYLPRSIEISVSNDGKNFNILKRVEVDKVLTDARLIMLPVGKTESRWVKIVAENKGIIPEGKHGAGQPAWLFADEIYIE